MQPIIYRGHDPTYVKAFTEHQEALSARYVEVLGEARAERLAKMADRLLPESSFLDTIEQANRAISGGLSRESPNRLLLALSHDEAKGSLVDNEGRVGRRKVRTASALYLSGEGFQHTGSCNDGHPPISSLVHEYDHFVFYALQRVPLEIAQEILDSRVGTEGTARSIEEYIVAACKTASTPAEARRNLAIGGMAYTLRSTYERWTRILDHEILKGIGIEKELCWRHKRRQYEPLTIQGINLTLMMPNGGDPWPNLSNQEVIDQAFSWERHLSVKQADPFVKNVIATLPNLKVSRWSFEELKSSIDGKEE